jgi:ribosomal protein L16 Arg81 hydroxylase
MKTIKVNWDNFISKVDLLHDDKPIVINNFIENVEMLVSWQEVENVFNKNECSWRILDDNQDLEVPLVQTEWVGQVQNKDFIHEHIKRGKTFAFNRYSYHNIHTKFLSAEIEKLFNVTCDMHVYGCTSSESSSFPVHYDFPTNFIIQCYGSCDWVIYKNKASGLIDQLKNKGAIDQSKLEKQIETKLQPGDMVYIPAMQYHAAFPDSPRLSLSIPCRPGIRGRLNKRYYKL